MSLLTVQIWDFCHEIIITLLPSSLNKTCSDRKNGLNSGGEKKKVLEKFRKAKRVTEVLMVISWTESRRAVPCWQQISKCFVLTKLVQSNQEGPDTMINISQSCAGIG